jgi:hypothetical protein
MLRAGEPGLPTGDPDVEERDLAAYDRLFGVALS